MYREAGLDAEAIVTLVNSLLGAHRANAPAAGRHAVRQDS
jgi:hypothetical protein